MLYFKFVYSETKHKKKVFSSVLTKVYLTITSQTGWTEAWMESVDDYIGRSNLVK